MLRSTARNIILNCSRQSGKSTVTAILAVHTSIFRPGSLTLLFSAAQRQSAELLSKVAELYKLMDNPPEFEAQAVTSLKLANGSRVISLPGDANSTRGFSAPDLVIEDEAAFCADDLYNSLRPMLAVSNGKLVLLSTPHGKIGHFHAEWTSDADAGWEKIAVKATECPRITAEFLAAEKARLGPWSWRQEFMTEFVEIQGAYFAQEKIDSAFSKRVKPLGLEWPA